MQVRPFGHPGYTESLPREPESAAAARQLVRISLSCLGLDALTEDGVLIVSELVANTVQHARRESIRVTVTRPGPAAVRIAVVDFSKVSPQRRGAAEDAEDGRGLAIVEHLAAAWGTDPLPWGKRVWAELRGGQ
ncbi:ATP-binding protein [Streptomyces chumphonensis]|uniref:ATP-binding protein n=1 Tax=Streptomyces chumphonensis TaxID=1214925 RepID=UPI003644A5E5